MCEAKSVILLPDVVLNEKGVTLETHKLENTMSSDSERTVSVSGSGSVSTDSERTPVRVDSQDSQVSDGEPGDGRWPRQNSVCIISCQFWQKNGIMRVNSCHLGFCIIVIDAGVGHSVRRIKNRRTPWQRKIWHCIQR